MTPKKINKQVYNFCNGVLSYELVYYTTIEMKFEPPKVQLKENAIESLDRGEKGKHWMQTSNIFSFDTVLAHVQLNQFDN